MVTTRLMRVLKSTGIGLSMDEVTECVDALSLSLSAGVLRVGEYNMKMIDSLSQAWISKMFTVLPAYEYTHGEKPLFWLEEEAFRRKMEIAANFIKLPHGHPIIAEYSDGQVINVFALTAPGEYTLDITDYFAPLFPAGIDPDVTAVYAIVSSSEVNWVQEAWRTGLLVQGERGYIQGVDRLTLAWVDGVEVQQFLDYGVLGALSAPVFLDSSVVDNYVDNMDNSNYILIAVHKDWRCALYCSARCSGEIMAFRSSAGAGVQDTLYVDLDSGDTVGVTDILALKDKSEGDEVFYIRGETCVFCDEYGKVLLGSHTTLWQE